MWDLIVSVPDHCLSFYFKFSSYHPFIYLFIFIIFIYLFIYLFFIIIINLAKNYSL